MRISDWSQTCALPISSLPATECLADTVTRVLPLWHDAIVPSLRRGEQVLIAAHGNSLRALVKYLDNLSEDAVLALNIPTGIPLVYVRPSPSPTASDRTRTRLNSSH